MGTRVYVGRLSYRVHERDLERFFKGYGRITEILLKNGYAFVEFSDRRDADDAVHDLNGRTMLGERVVVQTARSRPRGRDMYRERFRDRSRSNERKRSRSRSRGRKRSPSPIREKKKRRHSSSVSASPDEPQRRMSSPSQSPSPRKIVKKSSDEKKKKPERSSSSRSPSPDLKKSKDKKKDRVRHESDTDASVDNNVPVTNNVIVSGFENTGKFEKRMKHIAKKYGDVILFKMNEDNTCVIGYSTRESANKALEKISLKEVDGQTVQVTKEGEEIELKNNKIRRNRSPSEGKSRSRTNSGCSASGGEDIKNGSVGDNNDSDEDHERKTKSDGDRDDFTTNGKHADKRTPHEYGGFEKNAEDCDVSNNLSPNLKKKKRNYEEEDEPAEVDSTEAVDAK